MMEEWVKTMGTSLICFISEPIIPIFHRSNIL